MRLDELVVEDFRKLRGRHVVRPAPSGITVVSGDNEEGKSTLLDALKRAFFMKHNTTGEARESIMPLGRDATPAVAVAFRLAGRDWRLEKQFRRGGVRLEGPEGTLEGDAAELELARLLAFEWPGRGAAKPEHMGLAGLLWVDQGTTFDPEQRPSPTAMRRLAPALADQVAVLGRGERAPRLMTEVRRRRDEFWTGSRGQARGRLLELEKEVATLAASLAELEADEQAIETLLDRLAQTSEKRRAWLAADHLGRAQADVQRTRSALASVRALEEEQRVRAAEAKAAAADLTWLKEKAGQRRKLADEIAAKTAERAGILGEMKAAAADLELARRQRAAAETAETESRTALDSLERQRHALARQAERLRLERELAVLEATAVAVQEAARLATEQEALAEAEPLTPALWRSWRSRRPAWVRRGRPLRAVATRLVLVPERPGATVRRDGAPIDTGAPIELTAPAVLELEGFGRLEVTPGGEKLGALREALRQGEAQLAARLAELGAPSIAEARRRLAAREERVRAAAAARQRLADRLAATGMEDPAALEAALARARARLAGLDDVQPPADADEAALDAAAAEVATALEAARERHASLAARRADALARESELVKAAEQRAFTEARIEAEIARLLEQLAIEREALGDEALAERLAEVEASSDALVEAVARIERELARAAPEAAKREAEQAERRLAQLVEEGRNHDREAEALAAELKGAGGRGIGDQKAAVQGQLELAQRRHAHLLAEAQAWRLLHDTMEAVDRARQDALVEPLENRIAPYLRQLMGNAALGLAAESLQLDVLERGAVAEPFKSLSVGTREQLAVLVRLAIGDLLCETMGECPPLILDDALVYADAVRLARMKTILEAAAERQQIIILTCRKEDYLGLDARYLTLEDCRVEG
jgi:energy-coupling factor transporter ATP-binding protein EcfA2